MSNSRNKDFMGVTIDKHISVGHIFTTVGAIIAGVSAYANMQNRIYNLEKQDINFEKRIDRQREDHQRTLDRIFTELQRINNKLDNKADRK